MDEKSGIDQTGRDLPCGGGGIRSTSDTFQPNLAMGGGSYRVPIDLPQGAGGFCPKLDLLYHTGYGSGHSVWLVAVAAVHRAERKSAFAAAGETEYSLSGAEG
jgi:hypothetical protein